MKNYSKEIAANNAVIAEQEAIVKAQKELAQKYYTRAITWEDYDALAFSKGVPVRQRAENVVEGLRRLNALLSGEKLYFNGSYHTDVHPYELIEVKSATEFVVREMKATKADSEPYSNNWNIESNEKGRVIIVKATKTASGVRFAKKGDKYFRFGVSTKPHYYYDFSF